MAFFAVIYCTGLRPEEAVNLRIDNVNLPPPAWNEETSEWIDEANKRRIEAALRDEPSAPIRHKQPQ